MKKPKNLLLTLTLSFAFALGAAAEEPQHLFILSGQSNMTGGLEQGFTREVAKAYGEGNVTVVRSMKSGRGIRFWVKDYEGPKGSKLEGKKSESNGEEYPRLLKAAQDAMQAKAFGCVTFVWMQGESDAGNGLQEAYAKSFRALHEKLKTDLKLGAMPFVIGRISDYGLGSPNEEGWKKVRETQVALAEQDKLGAWVDTDDLNGGKDGEQLHYGSEESITLGERLAKAAVRLLETR